MLQKSWNQISKGTNLDFEEALETNLKAEMSLFVSFFE